MRLVFLIATLCLITTTAKARLGETRAQCEARYGAVVKDFFGSFKDELHHFFLYEKNGYEVTICYVGDVAGEVTIQRDNSLSLTPQEVAGLLEANKGTESWTKVPDDMPGVPTWTEPSGNKATCLTDNDIKFTSPAFEKAEKVARSKEDAEALKGL